MARISDVVRLNVSRIEGLQVDRKFKVAFRSVLTRIVILLVLLIGMGVGSISSLTSLYQKYYAQNKMQGEIRIDIQSLARSYLQAYAATDAADRTDALDNAVDKIASMEEQLDELEKIYDDTAHLTQVETDLATLSTYGNQMSALFDQGASGEEIIAYFDGTLYPQIQAVAADMKTVRDSSQEAAKASYTFSIILAIVVNIIAILGTIVTFLFIRSSGNVLANSVLEPVNELKAASDEMAQGKLNLNITYDSADELGELARDLKRSTEMTESIVQDISVTLGRMASGDFSRGSEQPNLYIGDYAEINDAFDDITQKLSHTLSQVKESSTQVSIGSQNMSQGASSLAEGATDQAAAIEELTASVTTVTEQTRTMANSAKESLEKAAQVKENAENSANKMHLVTDAMERITDASNQIEAITNSIEAIAKQTQLLALNASIEAARAGEAGKGFAVVAEEISALATQSTDAAKNTHQLIEDTMDEIRNGNIVVGETKEALQLVHESIDEITEMIHETEEMARRQSISMDEIDSGIEQISSVIQNNSATAEESSAVSSELSDQSDNLNRLISQFSIGKV